MKQHSITHKGVVVNRMGDKAIVHLIQPEGCHTCSMKSLCGVDDEERNRFEVPAGDLTIGDQVSLEINSSTGLEALFWAYLSPFLLILFVLIGGSFLDITELWLGILSLLILPPYFFALAGFRKKLKSHMDLKVLRL